MSFDSVLVTGGSGFIGSHTVDALLDSGVRTWVIDDFSSGSRRNLFHRRNDHALHIVKGSVTNFKMVAKVSKKVEAAIHLAAIVSPFISVTQPSLTNRVNVEGTLNVLNAALSNEVERVVFASSSSVYGDTGSVKWISESVPTNPITPYGASKLSGEKYCMAFCKTHGISTVSLRYFNVYGERQRDNPYSGVIAIFAHKLLTHHSVTIYGDGEQTRDFIHVSDVASANLKALAYPGKGDSFNVGTSVRTSINDLYATISEVTGKPHKSPTRKMPRTGDIKHSCANISKAKSVLHFKARVPLEKGISQLIQSLHEVQ